MVQNYFNTILAGFLGFIGSVYWLFTQLKEYKLRFEFDLDISFFSIIVSLFTLFLIGVFYFILSDAWKKFDFKAFVRNEPWGKALGFGLAFDFFIFVLMLIYENGLASQELLAPLIPLGLFAILYQAYTRYQIGVVFLVATVFSSAGIIGILYLFAY